MEVLLQQIINGLVLGSMYALVALGYTMVYGIIGLINFAHGEVLMVGALTSWMLIGWMTEAWAGLPNWVQMSRKKATMEDFPLVPVTAATISGWAP